MSAYPVRLHGGRAHASGRSKRSPKSGWVGICVSVCKAGVGRFKERVGGVGDLGKAVEPRWVGAGLGRPLRGSSGCLWSSPTSRDAGPWQQKTRWLPSAEERASMATAGWGFHGEDYFNHARTSLQRSPEWLQLPGVGAPSPAHLPGAPCAGGRRRLRCFPGPKPLAGAWFGRGSSLDG